VDFLELRRSHHILPTLVDLDIVFKTFTLF
jgi:hypothetical protein